MIFNGKGLESKIWEPPPGDRYHGLVIPCLMVQSMDVIFPLAGYIERVEQTPEKQQVSMMIDGIPAPGPSIFTKRTLLVQSLWWIGPLFVWPGYFLIRI